MIVPPVTNDWLASRHAASGHCLATFHQPLLYHQTGTGEMRSFGENQEPRKFLRIPMVHRLQRDDRPKK